MSAPAVKLSTDSTVTAAELREALERAVELIHLNFTMGKPEMPFMAACWETYCKSEPAMQPILRTLVRAKGATL